MYFKVLKGLQTGASIEIENNRHYSVANNLDADIFLRLDDDQLVQFTFRVSDSGVSFSNVSGNVTINNVEVAQAIIEENIEYKFPLRLAINDDTLISVSPHDETLLPFGDVNDIDDTGLSQQLSAAGITTYDGVMATPPVAAKPQLVTNWLKQQWLRLRVYWRFLRRKLGKILYAITGVVIAMLLISIFSSYQLIHQQNIETAASQNIETKQRIQKRLLELPSKYTNLKLSQPDSSTYLLSGMLPDQASLDYLQKDLAKVSSNIKFKVVIFEQIKPQIIELLGQYHLQRISVYYQNDNSGIVVSGLIDNIEDINDAEIALNNKFGDIGQVDTSHIYPIKDFDTFLNKLASEAHGQLSIEKNYDMGKVLISGYLTASESKDIATQVNQFVSQHNNIIQIQMLIDDTLKAVPFLVQEVYTGSPSWLITEDGTKIYEGGSYKGVIVKAIDNNRIVFSGKFNFTLSMDELMQPLFRARAQKNDSFHQQPESMRGCDRRCIIEQELARESELIRSEQEQLAHFQKILATTTDHKLQAAIKSSIDNLVTDLRYREHGFKLSSKEVTNAAN